MTTNDSEANDLPSPEQPFDARLVSLVDERALAQVALAFAVFLGQDVALEGFLAFETPGGGAFKPLLRATVGFHFRHRKPLFSVSVPDEF